MEKRKPFGGELQAEKADRGLRGQLERMHSADPELEDFVDSVQSQPEAPRAVRRAPRVGDGFLEEAKRSRTWMWTLLGLGVLIVARWVLNLAG